MKTSLRILLILLILAIVLAPVYACSEGNIPSEAPIEGAENAEERPEEKGQPSNEPIEEKTKESEEEIEEDIKEEKPSEGDPSIEIPETATPAEILAAWQKKYTAGSFGVIKADDPFVELSISNGDSIRLELFPWLAPTTVDNFIGYVEEGFYEGVVFHRVIKDFMIQTGGFVEKDGIYTHKDPTHAEIYGEFMANNFYNNLAHVPGVISMARSPYSYDSASSQFFICAVSYPSLNGYYAAFGRVIDEESMAAVHRIENVRTHSTNLYYGDKASNSDDVPIDLIYITKATLVWSK